MDDARSPREPREHALYAELLAVYTALRTGLAREDAAEPAWLAERHAAAERIAGELRALAGVLAPHRMTGHAVAPAVRTVWQASAAVAAAAAAANRELRALAEARQATLQARLADLQGGRRALSAYRPTVPDRPRCTTVSA